MKEHYIRWISMAVVVLLSVVATIVFFGWLDSTGEFVNKYVKFGGAAAFGLVAMLILLRYDSQSQDYLALKREISRYRPTQDFQTGESTIDSVIRDLDSRHTQYGRIIPFHCLKK